MMWRDRLPLVRSLRTGSRGDLSTDVAAGLTVGVMLVPQGMAYALLAGLPAVHGLYAALVPLVLYALLGTSRQLSVGPVAMDSLLVAAGVAPLANGDPERYLTLALTLAAMVGAMQLAMGLMKAGYLVNLLSRPVLTGFTAAAALIIGTSQLGSLLGLPIDRGPVHQILRAVLAQASSTHPWTFAIGVTAISGGVLLRRWTPRVPAAMVLVVVGTFFSWFLLLGDRGVATVGTVPSGFPVAGFPIVDTSDLAALFPVALAISLVGFMESIAVAKVYASRFGYDLDPNQELRALGAANLAGSVFQGFPVAGGFSRTAVNAQAGARSQIASLVSVGVVAVTLLFLTPLFFHLPNAILAAIIVTAVAGLIDWRTIRQLWRVDRRDFWLMLATFAATLLLGVKEGILVGAAFSIMVVLDQIARPPIAVLGRIPGTRSWRNVTRNPEAIVEQGVAVLRMDASLFYGNAEAFREGVRGAFAEIEAVEGGRSVVLDAYPMNRADSTGLHVLHELISEIEADSGTLFLASVKGPLRDTLETGGILERIGSGHVYEEVEAAVEAARRLHGGQMDGPGPTAA